MEITLSIPDSKVQEMLRLIGKQAISTGKMNGKHLTEKKVWGVGTQIVLDAAAKGTKFSTADLVKQCKKKGLSPQSYTAALDRFVKQGKICQLNKGSRGNPSTYKAA